MTVMPLKVKFAPPLTMKTRSVPLAEMTILLAFGLLAIVSLPAAWIFNTVLPGSPENPIVHPPLSQPGIMKLIVSSSGVEFAALIAARRLPSPSLSVLVTV